MASPQWLRRLQPSERTQYRWLEMLPGLAVWLTLVSAITILFVKPVWAIAFVVVFDVYWLVRVLYVMTYLILAYRHFRHDQAIDWQAQLEMFPAWRRVRHVVMLPTYGESEAVLRGTLNSLTSISYPREQMFVVLATEGREHDRIAPIAGRLLQEYQSQFGHFIVTEHPDGVSGEIAGKGANIAFAGHQVKKLIDQWGWLYADILVSTFDADSVAHPQYFSYLTVAFLRHPNRLRTSYQPIPLFHNNVWDALALTRVVATSTTFWLLGDTMRPDRLFTFSSHSMPWQALVDVGFWQNDVVSEDSRIFVQCLLRYDGDYSVTPMYIPISMDTVQAGTFWRSMVNQYKQIRRWAYGVENFPYMVWNFLHGHTLPRRLRIRLTLNQFEGTFSWATAPVLILLLGWLPFHIANAAVASSVLAQTAPGLLQGLMTGAMIGLVTSAVISTALLPRRPQHIPVYQSLVMVVQWLLLPITMILFGSVPAIEAQTRLLLGKYLGFWVTEKSRR